VVVEWICNGGGSCAMEGVGWDRENGGVIIGLNLV